MVSVWTLDISNLKVCLPLKDRINTVSAYLDYHVKHYFYGKICYCLGTYFILGGSKITAYGDCSHEIKRRLLLGREVMANLDSLLKSRDITLPTKVRLVKAMVFPVVMYGCESWSVKKAEPRRIDAFELWYWYLESPLDCKEIQPVNPKGNQS